MPPRTRHKRVALGGIELDLVLEARDRAIPVDNQDRDQPPTVDDAFGTEHHGEIGSCRSCRKDRPRLFEEPRIRRRHALADSVAWNVAFWEADEVNALSRPLSDRVFSQRH